jgi:hypothetical protein
LGTKIASSCTPPAALRLDSSERGASHASLSRSHETPILPPKRRIPVDEGPLVMSLMSARADPFQPTELAFRAADGCAHHDHIWIESLEFGCRTPVSLANATCPGLHPLPPVSPAAALHLPSFRRLTVPHSPRRHPRGSTMRQPCSAAFHAVPSGSCRVPPPDRTPESRNHQTSRP